VKAGYAEELESLLLRVYSPKGNEAEPKFKKEHLD
jgi:hypothetical protein